MNLIDLIRIEIIDVYDSADQWIATAIHGLSEADEEKLASAINAKVSDPEDAEDLLWEAVDIAESLARQRVVGILEERIREIYEARGRAWSRQFDLHIEERPAEGRLTLALAGHNPDKWYPLTDEKDIRRLPELVQEYLDGRA